MAITDTVQHVKSLAEMQGCVINKVVVYHDRLFIVMGKGFRGDNDLILKAEAHMPDDSRIPASLQSLDWKAYEPGMEHFDAQRRFGGSYLAKSREMRSSGRRCVRSSTSDDESVRHSDMSGGTDA